MISILEAKDDLLGKEIKVKGKYVVSIGLRFR